jgi:hypothetical protein
MSTVSVEGRRVNGNGNGQGEIVVVGPRLVVAVSRGRLNPDPDKGPFCCTICGHRLNEQDTARLEEIFAKHGRQGVRTICLSHTGAMKQIEFDLLGPPPATATKAG